MHKVCRYDKNHPILFVSHKQSKCGVYELGVTLYNMLKKSHKYHFVKVECDSLQALHEAIKKYNPSVIIYNYHPTVLSWLIKPINQILAKSNINRIPIIQIGLNAEWTQASADKSSNKRSKYIFGLPYIGLPFKLRNSLFDYYINPDPTLSLTNPIAYKTNRYSPPYENRYPTPDKITIGSCGFATPGKGFENIITLVQEEFDEAIIRLNIPFAEFGDKSGIMARKIAENCQSLIRKKGIKLYISHDFLSKEGMLDFLAQNTINVFLYENMHSRGIASTTDSAISVRRPIAISNSPMFKHLFDVSPSIVVKIIPMPKLNIKEVFKKGLFAGIRACLSFYFAKSLIYDYRGDIKKNTLKTVINNGFDPLIPYYNAQHEKNIIQEYEDILDSIFTDVAKHQKK